MNIKLAVDLIGQLPAIIALVRDLRGSAAAQGVTITITSIENETVSTAQASLAASAQWRLDNPPTAP